MVVYDAEHIRTHKHFEDVKCQLSVAGISSVLKHNLTCACGELKYGGKHEPTKRTVYLHKRREGE